MPAMPSCTVAGAFGIARTTGTPSASCASIAAVGMAAATESTVCFDVSDEPISDSSASRSCGFTATTTRPAPATASAFASVASMPCRSCSSSARSWRRAVTTMSPFFRQPDDSRPATSASPIFPQPRIAIRLAMPESRRLGGRHGHEAACPARQQVHRCQPRPLAVRREQLLRLPTLHAPAAERAEQLHEPEVADEAVIPAAEPLQRDDAERPRAEPALAEQPRRDVRRRHVA